MESSRVPSSAAPRPAAPAAPAAPAPTALTRALCLLILLLMSVAVIYGAAIAIRNFNRIGV